jgi:hypothetical protein
MATAPLRVDVLLDLMMDDEAPCPGGTEKNHRQGASRYRMSLRASKTTCNTAAAILTTLSATSR